MTKWEYLSDTFTIHGEASSNLARKTQTGMNKRGVEGWEVMYFNQTGLSIVVWYKRPNQTILEILAATPVTRSTESTE